MFIRFLLFLFLSLLCACSHVSKAKVKKDLFKKIALSSLVGGVYGASFKENKKENVILFSSLLGLGMSVYGIYHFRETEEMKLLKEEVKILKEQNGLSFLGKNKSLLQKGVLSFSKKPLPSHLKHLVVPGEWSLYKLEGVVGREDWVQIEPFRVLRRNHLFEIKPARINPLLRKEFVK